MNLTKTMGNTSTEETACQASQAGASQTAQLSAGDASDMARQVGLPTLQKNALSKIFGRAEFTPNEVAALGYRRIKMAEGIGHKGVKMVLTWLAAQGYLLEEKVSPSNKLKVPTQNEDDENAIERAKSLLRSHGYEVKPLAETDD